MKKQRASILWTWLGQNLATPEGQGSVSGTTKVKTSQRPGSYIEAPAGAIFPSDQIPATLAYQHAAVSDSQLQLVVTVGPRAFLVNNSASPVLLRAGAIICGFYKGKWWVQRRDKEGKASQEATEKDIQFTLQAGLAPSRSQLVEQALANIPTLTPEDVKAYLNMVLASSDRSQRRWLAKFRRRWGARLGILKPCSTLPLKEKQSKVQM